MRYSSIFFLLIVIVAFASCNKKSSQTSIYMQGQLNGKPYKTNFCELYQVNNFWVVDGWTYKQSASEPPTYPRVELFLRQHTTTGNYLVGQDSVTAYYLPKSNDTVEASGGTISIDYVYPTACGGIRGSFSLTFKDGSAITDGRYVSSPWCGSL